MEAQLRAEYGAVNERRILSNQDELPASEAAQKLNPFAAGGLRRGSFWAQREPSGKSQARTFRSRNREFTHYPP